MLVWIVSTCLLVLVCLALRQLLRGRVDPRLTYGLWLLVALRVLIPFSPIHSPVSVAGLVEQTGLGGGGGWGQGMRSQSRHGDTGAHSGPWSLASAWRPIPAPLTLSVLCPQAPAAGARPSGAGIVCGAAAPSPPLNQLSFFFSLMLLFLPRCRCLFSVFSSAGSCWD